MAYTERFSEVHKLLAVQSFTTASTEQNTNWLDGSHYHRYAIVIRTDVVGTNFNADIELSNTGTGAGTNVHTLKSITEITADEATVCIELRGEELSKPANAPSDEYRYFRVETTPSGNCNYTVMVFGISPRYAPVGVSEWDEVVV